MQPAALFWLNFKHAPQGRHPFVYALAEFVDNSLRATRRNAPRPRSITLSLVVSGSNPSTARGLVAIHDNGCGMNKHELADWVRAAAGAGDAGGGVGLVLVLLMVPPAGER